MVAARVEDVPQTKPRDKKSEWLFGRDAVGTTLLGSLGAVVFSCWRFWLPQAIAMGVELLASQINLDCPMGADGELQQGLRITTLRFWPTANFFLTGKRHCALFRRCVWLARLVAFRFQIRATIYGICDLQFFRKKNMKPGGDIRSIEIYVKVI